MCLTSGTDAGCASKIFTKMNEVLCSCGISWDECVSLGVDNTSVNLRVRNSIVTRVQAVNPNVYFMGSPCHSAHNIANHVSDAFGRQTGFDVEELVAVFYWFDKSIKRKCSLKEYCHFCDKEYANIIKHVSTCWLSLGRAVERTLECTMG